MTVTVIATTASGIVGTANTDAALSLSAATTDLSVELGGATKYRFHGLSPSDIERGGLWL